MNSLVVLVFLLLASLVTHAQKDTERLPSKSASSKDSALAKTLAQELKSAGVVINEKDLDEITQAMTKGGQSAMSIAQQLLSSIAEIKHQQFPGKPASQQKVELTVRQIDNILDPIRKGKDSSLHISRYLNQKLTQLKKANPSPVLTSQQSQWLKNNYKRIGIMEKDSAPLEVRKYFTSIQEASMEYIISEASRLIKADSGKELARLQQVLNQLKEEKHSLMDRIEDKQLLLDEADDLLKRQKIGSEIQNLKSQLKKVEEDILKMEEERRRIEAKS